MSITSVSIKIDSKLKKDAQEVAKELGISLSSMIKAYLKQVIRTGEVSYSIYPNENVPSEYLLESLKESEENYKAGDYKSFDNAKDATNYLNDVAENAD